MVSSGPSPVTATGSTRGVVRSIQILRALAALAVVYFHCADPGEGYSLPASGEWGVDVFFVISGFIIARMMLKDTTRFFTKRLIRIWPMYALATVLMAVMALAFSDRVRTTTVSLSGLIKSLLFVPYDMERRHGPILELGWTLTYEIFFYLLVGLALLLLRNRTYAVIAVVLVLVALVVSGEVAPADHYPVRFFQHDVLLEFGYGIALFEVWRRVVDRSTSVATARRSVLGSVALGLGVALVAGGITMMVLHDLADFASGTIRAVHFGLPALAVVGGALLTEHALPVARPVRFAIDVGDASYGMYLFHPFVVFGLYRLVFPHVVPADVPLASEVTAFVVLVTTTWLSLLLFRYVDRPTERWLRRVAGVHTPSAILR